MKNLTQLSSNRCFGGWQNRYSHYSEQCRCDMTFSLYLPEAASQRALPLMLWLSGLTCTDENFVTKAGAQRSASELGMILLAPDTSPRGEEVADIKDEWDIGQGAGFYLDATQQPWASHYRMYSYLLDELLPAIPALLESRGYCEMSACCISGHSMGGHGALSIALKNPQRFSSVSAFAPICAPMDCPWGNKAFNTYLGPDTSLWQAYDSCHLLNSKPYPGKIRIDQGAADSFLADQLLPERFIAVASQQGTQLDYSCHAGYDHSYFFIASFIEQHIRFHLENLGADLG